MKQPLVESAERDLLDGIAIVLKNLLVVWVDFPIRMAIPVPRDGFIVGWVCRTPSGYLYKLFGPMQLIRDVQAIVRKADPKSVWRVRRIAQSWLSLRSEDSRFHPKGSLLTPRDMQKQLAPLLGPEIKNGPKSSSERIH